MFFNRKKAPYVQSATADWQRMWKGLVPPECRDVPITVGDTTYEAYICIHHFVVMLQDGLLMEEAFFPVCEHFQRAGYHVIWLMRCTQDVYNGYLKKGRSDGRTQWHWRKPTTNFGRWISDNREATILIQHTELQNDTLAPDAKVLSRVIWATSREQERMIPTRTEFLTVDLPATPRELLRWLNGESLRKISEERKPS